MRKGALVFIAARYDKYGVVTYNCICEINKVQ